VLLALCLLAGAAAGCSSRAVSTSVRSSDPATSPAARSPAPSPSPAPSAVPVVAAEQPLAAATVRHLPPGAFYLLAGTDLASLNVWEVTPGGQEKQLTHNQRGYGIDALAASGAGIILADAANGVDDLARWTSHGPSWLHLPHDPRSLVRGSSPDIRGNGTIGYVTPPVRSATGGSSDFAIWTQRSFNGQAELVYRQYRPLDGPVFGPGGQIAIEGWDGRPGMRQPTMIIYGHGGSRKLHTGVSAIPSLVAWGQHAPALAIAFPAHDAELLFPDGTRQPLPHGWQPIAWNPAGSALLMQSPTALGVWSPQTPGRVATIGTLTPGVQILQAVWLARKAPQ